jgi:acyl-CoA thioester hydrolase
MTKPDPWPDLAGRLTDFRHILPVRIYFEDTDFSGVVYHGGYIRFMERARSDFVRLIGIGHTDLDAGVHGEPLVFAVRRIDIDSPLRLSFVTLLRSWPGRGILPKTKGTWPNDHAQ